jgi:hypothetical protein
MGASRGTIIGVITGAAIILIGLIAAFVLHSWISFYLLTACIGAGLGLGEVTGRYRDDPAASLFTFPGLLYIAINAGASVAALALLQVLQEPPAEFKSQLTQALAAGFGAMAVFRSSLFTARIGNTDVGIGPASFLKVILDAVDSAVDRKRGPRRGQDVARIMRDVSFNKASDSLPITCFRMLLNVNETTVNNLNLEIAKIKTSSLPDDHKAMALGLALLPLVGETVLDRAVALLGKEIQRDRRLTISSLETLILLQRIRTDEDIKTLSMACRGLMANVSETDQAFIERVLDGIMRDAAARPIDFRRSIFVSQLISQFGEDVVRAGLNLLPELLPDPRPEASRPSASESVAGPPAGVPSALPDRGPPSSTETASSENEPKPGPSGPLPAAA